MIVNRGHTRPLVARCIVFPLFTISTVGLVPVACERFREDFGEILSGCLVKFVYSRFTCS